MIPPQRKKGESMHPESSSAPRLARGHALLALLLSGLLVAQLALAAGAAGAQRQSPQIEPGAGSWETWVLASGSELRLPPPPGRGTTQAELKQLQELAAQRPAAQSQIARWTSGGPAYRWNELAFQVAIKNGMATPLGTRAFALLNVAIYDATIAAWDSKYAYNRARPSVQFPALRTEAPVPNSPSYPSEHAAVASAAAGVLTYLFPKQADLFASQAAEAGQTVLVAGLNYPSDVAAGSELGAKVAARVIERAMSDGSGAPWTGSPPVGPGYWTGTNPVLPLAGTWKTWVLSSGSELRPGPPPAYNSPEMAADLQEVRAFQRTPASNSSAYFWEYGAGGSRGYWYWNELLQRKVLEYGLADNPPRAARAFVLPNVALYDSFVACWDAKYTYWAARPFQLDPAITTLFPSPNHPSYPSAHSCLSQSASVALAYLFARDTGSFYDMVEEAGKARIWAGIHTPTDVRVGRDLGWAVGQRVIAWAEAATSD